MRRQVIIIGSGPAGMNAALYAKRQNLDVLVLEKSAPGGQVVNTAEVENYIGMGKLAGADLSLKMHKDMISFGVEQVYGDVLEIKKVDNYFVVKSDLATYESDVVIVATGTKNRMFGCKNEQKFAYRGISWCAICDGNLYKGKDVAVLGGGNSAVEEAIYLAGICNKVTLIVRSYIKSDKISEEKLRSFSNVDILEHTDVLEFTGENNLDGVKVKTGEEEYVVPVSGVFEYIGQLPNTEILEGLIDLDHGYAVTSEDMETNIPGLFVVGDVRKKSLRQIVTATSDGAIAAIRAKKYINEL